MYIFWQEDAGKKLYVRQLTKECTNSAHLRDHMRIYLAKLFIY